MVHRSRYGRRTTRKRRFRRRRRRTRKKRNVANLPANAYAKLSLGYHFYWYWGLYDVDTAVLTAANNFTKWEPAHLSFPCVDCYQPYFLTHAPNTTAGQTTFGSLFGGLGVGEWLEKNGAVDAFSRSCTFNPRQPKGWDRLMLYYREYAAMGSKITLTFRQVGRQEIDSLLDDPANVTDFGVPVTATQPDVRGEMNNLPVRIMWYKSKYPLRAGEDNFLPDSNPFNQEKSEMAFSQPIHRMNWHTLRREPSVKEARLGPWEEQGRRIKITMYKKVPSKKPAGSQYRLATPSLLMRTARNQTSWNPTDQNWQGGHQHVADGSDAPMWNGQTPLDLTKSDWGYFNFVALTDQDHYKYNTQDSSSYQQHTGCLRVDGVHTFYVKLRKRYRTQDDMVYAKPAFLVDANLNEIADDALVDQGDTVGH